MTGRFCQSLGHERVPAVVVGVLTDWGRDYPDVAYCAYCAALLGDKLTPGGGV